MKVGVERGYVEEKYLQDETFLFNVANWVLIGELSNPSANPTEVTDKQYKRDVEATSLKIYTLISLPNKLKNESAEPID